MTIDLTKDHRRWLDELVLELRLSDVGGREIGDAVASAREFLADAGQPAEQVFGSPREYARELDLPTQANDGIGRTVALATVDLLGFLALAFAGGAAWRGERFDLDGGTALLVVSVTAIVLLTPRMLPVVLRARPWKIATGVAVFFASQVAVAFLFADVDLVSVPAWPVAALGLAVLLVSVVRAWAARDALADPVVEPLGPETHDAAVRKDRRLVVLPQVVNLAVALGFAVVDVLLRG